MGSSERRTQLPEADLDRQHEKECKKAASAYALVIDAAALLE